MNKYNVGDVVKLRDDLEVDRQYGGITVTNYKNEFKNERIKIIQISEADETYRAIDEDNNAIWISEEMIEGLWEECKEKQDKLKLIDVLNMIAKGELKEGTKVKWDCDIYIYENGFFENSDGDELLFFINSNECLNDEVELEPPCEHEWREWSLGNRFQVTHYRKCEKCGLEEETEDNHFADVGKMEKIEELIEWYETTDDESNEMLLHIVWDKLNEVIRKINKE